MNFVDIVYSEYIKAGNTSYYRKNIPIIRKISNVQVKTEIYFECINLEYYIYLQISTPNITTDSEDNNTYVLFKQDLRKCAQVTRKDIKVSLQKMKKIIPSLKFNKLLGKIDSDKTKSFEQICLNEFGSSFIESSDCCVCAEPTITKTNCSHFLCVECWSHIKSNQCPICREDNIYINELDEVSDDGSDSDDDDDY